MFTRYAIFYTPAPDTPLANFGANWLGWDSARGVARAHPEVDGLDVSQITATPRKYGFHGTLKPPFRLASGTTAQELSDAVEALCANAAPVALEGLHLDTLGRFLALVPTGDPSPLADLAGRAVQDLDRFRAPLEADELAKRRSARLSAAQEAHLLNWGYPYVLDQFRFHMTLSGSLDRDALALTKAALEPRVAALDLAPYHIDGLTLLGEEETGMFQQIHRYTLIG